MECYDDKYGMHWYLVFCKILYGTVWQGMQWYGIVWHGMAGYAMVWSVMMTGAARGELQEVTG